MPRIRLVDAIAKERRENAAALVAAIARKGPKKVRTRAPAKLAAELDEMVQTGDWSKVEPAHIVEFYAFCHRQVYGARPPELDRSGKIGDRERMGAISSVKKLVADCFEGDHVAAALFVRWAWKREDEREKWARSKKVERSRLTWRALFAGRGIYGDYLVACHRQKARL